jgi:uncharacterized protein YqkB
MCMSVCVCAVFGIFTLHLVLHSTPSDLPRILSLVMPPTIRIEQKVKTFGEISLPQNPHFLLLQPKWHLHLPVLVSQAPEWTFT